MKKNIIIAVLAIVSVFFITFSMIKMKEAEKGKSMAEESLESAIELRNAAEAAEMEAVKQAAIAIQQKIKADSLRAKLESCY